MHSLYKGETRPPHILHRIKEALHSTVRFVEMRFLDKMTASALAKDMNKINLNSTDCNEGKHISKQKKYR